MRPLQGLQLLGGLLFSAAFATAAASDRLSHRRLAGAFAPAPSSAPPLQLIHRLADNSTVLLAFTVSNTLTALDPHDGAIRWHRTYGDEVEGLGFLVCGDALIVWSRNDAGVLQAIAPATGKLLWADSNDRLTEKRNTAPNLASCSAKAGGDENMLFVATSTELRRVDPTSGFPFWTRSIDSATTRDLAIAPAGDITLLQWDLSSRQPSLSMSSFDLDTGAPRSIVATEVRVAAAPSSHCVLTLSDSGDDGVEPVYMWLQGTSLRAIHAGGPRADFLSTPPVAFIAIIDVGLARHGIVLGEREDHTFVALALRTPGTVDQLWHFRSPEGTSRFASCVDSVGGIHIGHLAWSKTLRLATMDVVSLESDRSTGAPVISGQTLAADLSDSSVSMPILVLQALSTGRFLPDFVAFLSTTAGSLQAWKGSELLWQRERLASAAPSSPSLSLPLPEDAIAERAAMVVRCTSARSLEAYSRSIWASDPIWKFEVAAGGRIVHVAAQSSATMVSPGRVDDSRSAVLKYRNADLLVILALHELTSTVDLHLIDAKDGSSVLQMALPAAFDTAYPPSAAVAEDWLICTYRNNEGPVPLHVVLSIDLTAGASSSNRLRDRPRTLARSFSTPSEMRIVGFTRTSLGITARDALFVDAVGQLVALPRRALDPRAGHYKRPSSGFAQNDLLSPGRVVGKAQDIRDLGHLVVAAGERESEVLVRSAESDSFAATLRPSRAFDSLNESFNRVQLVSVLAVLTAALVASRTSAARRRTRSKWSEG